MQIYGFAMVGPDLRLQAGQSGLVRRPAPDEAAVLPERVRRERQLLGERAADALRRARAGCRRAGARSRPSSSSTSSASAWTPARRRSACARPGASSAASSPARRTASSWTGTSSRTRRVLGTQRDGLLPQRPAALDADRRGQRARHSPSSGRERAATAGKYSDRIELQNIKGHFPYPDFTAHYQLRGRLGPRPARRDRPLHRLDRHAAGPVRPLGPRHRLGRQPELGHQGRQDRQRCGSRPRTARASRTT